MIGIGSDRSRESFPFQIVSTRKASIRNLMIICENETSRKQRRTSIVRNTFKPMLSLSPASNRPLRVRPASIIRFWYHIIAANEGVQEGDLS